MDNLPNELILDIFEHLTQRSLTICSIVCKKWHELIFPSLIYSTIEFYSYEQLEKFMETTKEQMVQNKPILSYVYHLKIYFNYKYFIKHCGNIVKDMINIQTIDIITNVSIATTLEGSMHENIPQLNQLTHIPEWYKGFKSDEQLYIFKNTTTAITTRKPLKSLEYCISADEHSQENIINMKRIGPTKSGKNPFHELIYDDDDSDDSDDDDNEHTYQSKVLVFNNKVAPESLVHLTHLKLEFPIYLNKGIEIYELDERTLESIHQSCLQLEKLQLVDFFMNISEEYNNNKNNNNNKTWNPSQTLKEFELDGAIIDPRCFIYFSSKYPQLVSFTFSSKYSHILDDDGLYDDYKDTIPTFQSTLYNMITGYKHLKRLSIILSFADTRKQPFWPHDEFLKWLNNNPQQLDHLAYPFCFIPKEKEKMNFIINDPINTIQYEPIATSFSFLNHLSSLSIEACHLIYAMVYYYFLNIKIINSNKTTTATILSNSVKELNIYQKPARKYMKYLYIYDYLDAFPNLDALIITNIGIKDSDDINKQQYIMHMIKKFARYGFYLNESLEEQINNEMNYHRHHYHYQFNQNSRYKLKKLELNYVNIRFMEGLNSFFSHFTNLNHLSFNNVIYSYPGMDDSLPSSPPFSSTISTLQNVFLNLSHLVLDFVSIIKFRIVPWENTSLKALDDKYMTDQIILCETLIDDNKLIIIDSDDDLYWNHIQSFSPFKGAHLFNLHITCKYLDKLIFY